MAFFNDMVKEFHGNEVSDPIVADNFFSCYMKMDAIFKDGKIVQQEFFYTPNPQG